MEDKIWDLILESLFPFCQVLGSILVKAEYPVALVRRA